MLGKHVIAELYGCNSGFLDDESYLETALIRAAKVSGATVLDSMFRRFHPQGVTGVVLLAESHISIHTWPEKGYAAVDVFTCGAADPMVAVDEVVNLLDAKYIPKRSIDRGHEVW
jgi:S-adenosylmethionine decarboxylase